MPSRGPLVETLRGEGVLRLPDGTERPTPYVIRVYGAEDWHQDEKGEPVDLARFAFYEVDDLPFVWQGDSGVAMLHLKDGRRLPLTRKRPDLDAGTTSVIAGGDLLPPEERALPMSHRHTVTTDRASIAADYAGLLMPGGTSMLEGDERRPGVPRHIAREAGRLIVQRGVGDGTHELGEGWTIRVEGERVEVAGPEG